MNAELIYAAVLKESYAESACDSEPESGPGKPDLFCFMRKSWKAGGFQDGQSKQLKTTTKNPDN